MYAPGSFHLVHLTNIENLRVSITSPDPITARVIQGRIDTSTTTIPLFTPEPSASSSPTSTSSPDAIAVQDITDRRTPSDVLDVPSLPSPTPVLDNILPTKSQSSLLRLATPGLSCPRLSSSSDLGAAAEGEGIAKAALHKERDALDPPSV
ncbi:hypothetical protein BJY52DRAFT_1316572 [Lactarius psammicola]|nr:hypothetical protein BJY52DRAFT_1316572 [Lactarius psammicola]